MMKTTTLLVFVVLAGLWTSALTGLANPLHLPSPTPGPEESSNRSGLRWMQPEDATASSNGVTISVLQAGFSSSESLFLLEISGADGRLTGGPQVDLEGFLGGSSYVSFETAEDTAGNPRFWLHAGPVIDPTVAITIHMRQQVQQDQWSDWSLSLTPGEAVRDPVAKFVELNLPVDYGDLVLLIQGVHYSSSQTLFFYRVEDGASEFVGPVDALISVRYPDGKKMLGVLPSEAVQLDNNGVEKPAVPHPLARGDYFTMAFPASGDPGESLTVEFGDILATAPSNTIVYLLADEPTILSVGSDSHELLLTVSDKQIVVSTKRSGSGKGTFVIGDPGAVRLTDETGLEYKMAHAEVGFRKEDNGTPVADRTMIAFKVPENIEGLADRRFKLETGSTGAVLEPSQREANLE